MWYIEFIVSHNNKEDNPYSIAFLTKTHVFEWYAIGCGSKNKYHRDVCLEDIGIVCSQYDIHMNLCDWGNLHDHTMST